MMTPQHPHLNELAIKHLALSDDERIVKIRSSRWIGYPQAEKTLAKLEDLLTYPKSHRMPNLLIVGDTNNGKTMLVQRFCKRHPPNDNPDGEAAIVPVLYIQAPPVPDEGRFYNTILEKLFAPFRPSDRVGKKSAQAIKLLKYVGLRMLVIDEIHQILAGNLNKQRAFLNVIKYIGNELQIPIIGVGTKEAFRAIQTDDQLANRFEPAPLPRWKDGETYRRLLITFERMFPLKNASDLHKGPLAKQILSMSDGYIGEISRLLTNAATAAVKQGHEKIDTDILNSLNWCAPPRQEILARTRRVSMLSGKLLPAHPKPLWNESLASWFSRVAEANLVKQHTLAFMRLGAQKPPWYWVLDVEGGEWFLKALCDATGAPLHIGQKTTLAEYSGVIFPAAQRGTRTQWILPTKIPGSRIPTSGTQFCPRCLSEGKQPYYRRQWRLAFYTFCPIHMVKMLDACSICGARIAFHRRDCGVDIDQAASITMCYNCGADLRSAKPQRLEGDRAELTNKHKGLLHSINASTACNHDLPFFLVLHHLCWILLSKKNKGKLREYICSKLEMPAFMIPHKRTPFSWRGISTRHHIIHLALWIMLSPKMRITDAWKEGAVRYASLVRDFPNPPNWYRVFTQKMNRQYNKLRDIKKRHFEKHH
nr:TniB family NTP-binding protein [uncultured Pseudodesulfovibrio sp.]